jgi:hypothetical protein
MLFLKALPANRLAHGNFLWPDQVGAIVKSETWNPEPDCGGGLHGLVGGNGGTDLLCQHLDAVWYAFESVDEKGNPSDAEAVVIDGQKGKCHRAIIRTIGTRDEATAWLVKAGCPQVAYSTITVGDFTTGTAGDRSKVTAGVASTASAGYYSTVAADTCGNAIARDYSEATVGRFGTAISGDKSEATADDYGIALAGHHGTAKAGAYGTAKTGDYGTSTVGNWGTAIAGNNGTATAGYGGTAIAGLPGYNHAGYNGTAIADCNGMAIVGNDGKAKGKDYSTLIFQDGQNVRTAIVGQNGIKPDTFYRLKGRKLAEA